MQYNTTNISLMIIGSYLVGSIPFAYIFAKAQGIDLRKVGSGNIGATNLGRALGKKWAVLCFFLDALKGFLPMLTVRIAFGSDEEKYINMWLWMAVGCAAIIGHIHPVFLKFKGGKGAATSLGMVLGLWPYLTIPGIVSFIVWGVLFLLWRYVSLASIIASIVFPAVLLACILTGDERWTISGLWPLLLVSSVMASLIVLKHKDNIKRLLEGKENRAGKSKDETSEE